MPVPIILDTDMDTDCDDVGAMAVLHALADNGEADLLGIICDAPTPWGAPCISAINSYYGRPEIPVGAIPVDGFETDSRYLLYREHVKRMEEGQVYLPYNQFVGTNFPHGNAKRSAVRDGVALYRELLSEQPDRSVTIAAIGLLTVLEGLLDSGPDTYSPLDGRSLVETKVRMLVTMGGGSFPEGRDSFNWWMDKEAAARVLNRWPTALAVSEWGEKVLTGARLSRTTPETNPVRRAYELYLFGPGKSRSSWDQVAVLYSIRGAGDLFTEIRGYGIHFSPETGEHRWTPIAGEDRQIYLQQSAPDDRLAEMIEELMIQPPAERDNRDNEDGSDTRAD